MNRYKRDYSAIDEAKVNTYEHWKNHLSTSFKEQQQQQQQIPTYALRQLDFGHTTIG